MDRIGRIYCIINKINNKKYIGLTVKHAKQRFWEHVTKSNNPTYNSLLHRAIKKYGKENFEITILEDDILENILPEKEIEYIEKYNTYNEGYNLTRGGEGRTGVVVSEETRRKLSEARAGYSWGKHTEETKRKMSDIRKGMKFTETHKKNLSIARRKRIITEETRQKMSDAWTDEMKEKQANRNRKPIICNETGEKYSCSQSAAEKMNLSCSSIYQNLHGRVKRVKGFSFRFKQDGGLV